MTSRDEAGTDPEQLPDNLEDLASRSERPAPFVERIDTQSFAGGIPQNQARLPQIRIGTHWISPAWPLIGLTIVGLLVAVAIAKQLRMYPWMQDFIATYPGWRISTGSPMGPFQIYDAVGMMTPTCSTRTPTTRASGRSRRGSRPSSSTTAT